MPVPKHSADIQILHHNHRLGFRQVRGEFVQEVLPDVADTPVQPGQPQGRTLGHQAHVGEEGGNDDDGKNFEA